GPFPSAVGLLTLTSWVKCLNNYLQSDIKHHRGDEVDIGESDSHSMFVRLYLLVSQCFGLGSLSFGSWIGHQGV
uniref:Uncharacterized protein n=1 Tax=Seriola dumerili TaxID=41447 RepID=A0A3B4U5C5_SERDU